MGSNPVLKTVIPIVEQSTSVSMDRERLKEVARGYASEKLVIPDWNAPVFPSATDRNTVDFLFLGNSINFAYTDIDTGRKFSTEYGGVEWSGAFGMWASLKRAMDNGIPILDGKYLAKVGDGDMKEIFSGGNEMPMLAERREIFREVGSVLNAHYNSSFSNIIDVSKNRLFSRDGGVVERLVSEFPSFADRSTYNGEVVIFNKRAQLAVAMAYGRFLGNKAEMIFPQDDIRQLTVFADYELPKVLRAMGLISYSPELSGMIESGKPIQKDSKEEVEIRANTIYTAKLLQDEINAIKGSDEINALHVDYKLWSEGRSLKTEKHHLTITTAY